MSREYDEVVLLLSRFNNLNRDERIGKITSDSARTKKEGLNVDLLNIVNNLKMKSNEALDGILAQGK